MDVCLSCYNGGCAVGSANQHGLQHFKTTGHAFALNVKRTKKAVPKSKRVSGATRARLGSRLLTRTPHCRPPGLERAAGQEARDPRGAGRAREVRVRDCGQAVLGRREHRAAAVGQGEPRDPVAVRVGELQLTALSRRISSMDLRQPFCRQCRPPRSLRSRRGRRRLFPARTRRTSSSRTRRSSSHLVRRTFQARLSLFGS